MGNPNDPGGNEVESEEMKEIPSRGQDRRYEKAWERVLVVANGFQETRTPAKNVVPPKTQEQSKHISVMLAGQES